MNLFKRLSTLTAVLLTTASFANAATTDVIPSELASAQPLKAEFVLKSVENNLAQSMTELKVSLNGKTLDNQQMLIAKANVSSVNKHAETKQVLIAE